MSCKLGASRPGSYKFNTRYRCVEYAFNAFGAHSRHDSVRYMRVPVFHFYEILVLGALSNASVMLQ